MREAFRALEQSGLVRTEKNRGVFVRQLSLHEADEIYEVRAALDGMIGRLAAQRIRAPQLQRLRDIIKRMHAAGRARDVDAYFPLNLEFHELLGEAAGNAALLDNYRRVVNELNLFRRETLARNAEHIPVSTKDHEAIVNAVAKGDGELAERLLFEHVIDSRERLHAALRSPRRRTAGAPRARLTSACHSLHRTTRNHEHDHQRQTGRDGQRRALPLADAGRWWWCASTAATRPT